MLDQFLDPGFLSALAATIGPLAVFVAPTEEIEAMIFDSYANEEALTSEEIGVTAAQPILPAGYREAA
ncbi:hypothetical protein [Aquidulcibacter sp.]|uniref:hypothetical protein n=1 Tax=Aquidulcibacter sp. TaxID=2052990 RepID=UPI00078EE2C5|nr:hypothetical protein AEM38_14095 [Hyphomonadaceae bacterium UKL13-1]OYU52118.1 MAG: hypothetical protein CFE27_07790 [Alphaproteobacteria bacterium PA1]HCP63997.1 hypothetical protein [Hyphomonadaceae bacterium]